MNYPVVEPEFHIPATTSSARDFFTIIFKQKAKIITVFLAVVLTALVGSFLMKPTYEAKTSMLMKIGREHLNRTDLGDNSPINYNLRQEEIINSEIEILMNRDLLEKVITTLKLETIYPDLAKVKPTQGVKPLDLAIERFRDNLKVNSVKKSNVVEVMFRHRDAQVAAKALNTLVELFKEKHLQVFSDPRSSFFEGELTSYEQKLKTSADKLEAFKQQNGVYSLEEQRTLLLRQRTDLDMAYKVSQNQIDELTRRLATLRTQFKTVSNSDEHYTTTERDRVITEAKSRLLALQLNEQELLKKYREDSRMVAGNKDEIKMVQQYLREQEEDVRKKAKSSNPIYQGVETELLKTEADLHAVRAKSATLRRQLAQVDNEVRSLDQRENNVQALKREVAANEKNYQVYRDKAEEARIAEDMNKRKLANISIIQAAVAPMKPIAPKKKTNVALAILIGLIAGLALAFVSENLSQTISTPGTAEKRLGLPVLAVIPYKE